MTYFGFLLKFILVPILIFLFISYQDNKRRKDVIGFQNGRAVWRGIGAHVLLAVLYTTPWDNYLVATGVWYYNPELVTGLVIGYVPIEEYTFFVLETVLSGLWWWFLARRLSPNFDKRLDTLLNTMNEKNFKPGRTLVYLFTSVVIFLWLFCTCLLFFGPAKWAYLSIILFWALPPIFVQLVFGADILWHYRKMIFWGVAVPAVYLSLADAVALKETTWSISPAQTTGILFFGILPLEEVIFFFVTNMLIIFGMTLLLANVSRERILKFGSFRRKLEI